LCLSSPFAFGATVTANSSPPGCCTSGSISGFGSTQISLQANALADNSPKDFFQTIAPESGSVLITATGVTPGPPRMGRIEVNVFSYVTGTGGQSDRVVIGSAGCSSPLSSNCSLESSEPSVTLSDGTLIAFFELGVPFAIQAFVSADASSPIHLQTSLALLSARFSLFEQDPQFPQSVVSFGQPVTIFDQSTVPEPASGMLGIGSACILAVLRRRLTTARR